MIKTILITGACGLLGSRVAKYIIENKEGYNLILLDDFSGGIKENINFIKNYKNIKFYDYNLKEEEKVNLIFKENQIDYVYHFAAYAAEGLSPFIRNYNYTNNLLASVNIINNCIKYNITRLVFTSSMAVYGKNKTPYSEDLNPNPIDPYGVAKYAVEMDIAIAGEQHNLDWCIIRPHNVYGINQNIWDKYRNVLGIWMYQSISNLPMTIYGDGLQTRSFSYIDDCLEPLWLSLISKEASKQIINLGSTEHITILEASKIVSSITNNNNIIHLEERHEIKEAIPSYQKSIDILKYKQITTLEQGLKNMWEWASEQPIKKRKEWDVFELNKNIYSYWKNKDN
jgi:UDP-glucose 4-epimerase